MILVFDIGNSNITIGAFEKKSCLRQEASSKAVDELIFTGRLVTDPKMDAQTYEDLIKELVLNNSKDISDVEGSVIGSVVPDVTKSVAAALKSLTGKKCNVVDSSTDYGLKVVMDDPKKVGTDLLIGAGYAASKFEAPLCVVDLGTFTTLCYVSKDKEYQGTIIIPGIKTCADSYTRAAQLFSFEIESPKVLLGRNTKDSMLSGLVYGAASMIDGIIDRIEQEKGELKTVVITGGFSGMLAPLLKREVIVYENLLLDGLFWLYYNDDRA